MPDAEIVFETPDGDLLALLPDAVLSESPVRGSDTTEQEVEAGLVVTDHVRERPETLALEAVFSNSPLRVVRGEEGQFWFGVEGSVRALSLEGASGPVLEELAKAGPPARAQKVGEGQQSVPSLRAWQVDGSEVTRVQDSWALIEDALEGAWLATVVTRLKTYEDMVLVGAETKITARDGSWIVVPLQLRKVRQVATELVEARQPLRPRGQPQTNEGAVATEAASADEEERVRASLASQGVSFLTELFQ